MTFTTRYTRWGVRCDNTYSSLLVFILVGIESGAKQLCTRQDQSERLQKYVPTINCNLEISTRYRRSYFVVWVRRHVRQAKSVRRSAQWTGTHIRREHHIWNCNLIHFILQCFSRLMNESSVPKSWNGVQILIPAFNALILHSVYIMFYWLYNLWNQAETRI